MTNITKPFRTKETGIEWIGAIPIEWGLRVLKRLLAEPLMYGATESGDQSDPEMPRYLRITDFLDDGTLRDDVFASLPEEVARPFLLCDGDVLFARSGATVGKAFLFRNFRGRACFAGYLIKANTLRRMLLPEFLNFYTKSNAYDSWKDQIFTQATIQNIGADKYSYLPVCLPPKTEQQRICAYLEASCDVISLALRLKRDQLQVLDELTRQSVQKAVTGGLNIQPTLKETSSSWLPTIPVHWELIALKRICEIHTGLTLGKTYEGPLIERRYLRVANVQDGHLDLVNVTTIEVPEVVARGVELRKDDVLMTEGGDLDKLGRGTVWNGEISGCLHQNHIFAIRCMRHKLLPMFLAYVTASKYGRDYFEATGKKTTNLASTNSTKVGLFPIPLPSIGEQEAICSHLKLELSRHNKLKRSIEKQVEVLVAFRKSLIHECVTGKRRITDEDVRRVQRKTETTIAELADSVA